MDHIKRAVAVGDVIGAQLAHIVGQVDEAVTAVDVAADAVPGEDIKEALRLVQHTAGRHGLDRAQHLPAAGIPVQFQVLDGPYCGVKSGEPRGQSQLIGLRRGPFRPRFAGNDPQAVRGACPQPDVTAGGLAALHPAQVLPGGHILRAVLQKIVVPLGLVPGKAVEIVPPRLGADMDHMVQKVAALERYGLREGAAKHHVPLPAAVSSHKLEGLAVGGHGKFPLAAHRQTVHRGVRPGGQAGRTALPDPIEEIDIPAGPLPAETQIFGAVHLGVKGVQDGPVHGGQVLHLPGVGRAAASGAGGLDPHRQAARLCGRQLAAGLRRLSLIDGLARALRPHPIGAGALHLRPGGQQAPVRLAGQDQFGPFGKPEAAVKEIQPAGSQRRHSSGRRKPQRSLLQGAQRAGFALRLVQHMPFQNTSSTRSEPSVPRKV